MQNMKRDPRYQWEPCIMVGLCQKPKPWLQILTSKHSRFVQNMKRDPRYQWIHPAAEMRDNPKYKGGKGLFATRLIKAGEKYFNGEFMADGMGEVVDIDTLNTWPHDDQMLFLHWCAQVGSELHSLLGGPVSLNMAGSALFVDWRVVLGLPKSTFRIAAN